MANTMLKDRNLFIAEAVVRIADDIGCTPAQVALNWVRQQNNVLRLPNKIIPIIGLSI
jgi:aryl-alcohol dehydrogenase-like predicted oxidoreductase